MNQWWPVAEWIPTPWNWAGAVFVVVGVGLTVWSAALFRRAKTGIVPFSESTSLVAAGPYRFTRNPMYLGMTCVLAGVAVMLGSATPWIAPPAFAAVITGLFIVPEERHMENAFGEAYREYKKRVRRWV